VLILREPRDGQERKQDSEDDPDINAHQSSGSYPPITEAKESPGRAGASQRRSSCEQSRDQGCPRRRYYPKAQIRQGADRISAPTRRCRIDGPGLAITQVGWVRHGQENYCAPDHRGLETGGRGLATTHGVRARHDQLTRLVRARW